MEFRQYFRVLWKWLWLILAAALIAAGIAYMVTSRQPKVYSATSKLLVGRSIQSVNPNAQDLQTSQQLALTYVEIAKTTGVLQGAIDAAHANESVDELARNMSATNIPETQLIELRVNDADPALAQALANEMAHQLTLIAPGSNPQSTSGQNDFVQRQAQDLQRKIDQAEKSIADIQNSIQPTTSTKELADKQQQIGTIQTQVTMWQQAYASLLPYTTANTPNYLSVIEPAGLPGAPISPNVPLTALLAGITGLILGIASAFLLEYLNDSLRTPDDVKQALHLPALGVIGGIKDGKDGKLLDGLSPLSPVVEAYRTVRYNLQFNAGDAAKTILVTSPNLGDGKSLTAANLAILMAQSGQRTILIDGDLRKPTQHQLFDLTNDFGLTNYFMPTPPSGDLVRPTRIENLCLVTSGVKALNPAELLASERMRKLLARLQNEADVVILDSPPCLSVVDSTILARIADGVVMVVDSKHTPRRLAQRAKEVLTNAGGRLTGVILNRTATSASRPYYD